MGQYQNIYTDTILIKYRDISLTNK